jgi:RimJ/RimL family protein N-acetyltransferase
MSSRATESSAAPHSHALPVLSTDRLVIRPLTTLDLDECCRLYRAIGWDVAGLSGDEARERRRSWLDWTIAGYQEFARLMQLPYGERAIALKDDGRFLGLVGIVPAFGPFSQLPSRSALSGARWSPEVGLFWALLPEVQGQGFATEAAERLMHYLTAAWNLQVVVATTERDNATSIAVMRRLGMSIEANPFSKPAWFQVVGSYENPADSSAEALHPLRDRARDS